MVCSKEEAVIQQYPPVEIMLIPVSAQYIAYHATRSEWSFFNLRGVKEVSVALWNLRRCVLRPRLWANFRSRPIHQARKARLKLGVLGECPERVCRACGVRPLTRAWNGERAKLGETGGLYYWDAQFSSAGIGDFRKGKGKQKYGTSRNHSYPFVLVA